MSHVKKTVLELVLLILFTIAFVLATISCFVFLNAIQAFFEIQLTEKIIEVFSIVIGILSGLYALYTA